MHILYTYLQREKLKYNKKSLFYIITKFIKFNLMRHLPSYKKVKWFNLDKRIKKHFVFLMNKSNLKFVKDDCNFRFINIDCICSVAVSAETMLSTILGSPCK